MGSSRKHASMVLSTRLPKNPKTYVTSATRSVSHLNDSSPGAQLLLMSHDVPSHPTDGTMIPRHTTDPLPYNTLCPVHARFMPDCFEFLPDADRALGLGVPQSGQRCCPWPRLWPRLGGQTTCAREELHLWAHAHCQDQLHCTQPKSTFLLVPRCMRAGFKGVNLNLYLHLYSLWQRLRVVRPTSWRCTWGRGTRGRLSTEGPLSGYVLQVQPDRSASS